ncbi:MAG: polysaccharide export protein [Flavobacteriales bacterium]|nr:polysaccharide export protein [Flavobacteriales bacterium]
MRYLFYIVILFCASGCAYQNMMQTQSARPISDLNYDSAYYQIRKDDKISLSVWNHDDLSIGSLYGIYNSNEVYGKWVLVDEAGEVTLPRIGSVKIEGLSIKEAEDTIVKRLANLIVDPIVKLKVLNRSVTVLGEVRNPGSFPLEKEKHYLLEIIGKSGGLEFYADKSSVKLVRLSKDGPVEYQIDLTKGEELAKTNVLLQNGDVIYVPTRKGKNLDKKAPTLIPFTSVVTAIVLVLTVVK